MHTAGIPLVDLFDLTDRINSALPGPVQDFTERLGLSAGLAPDDPGDMLAAVRSLNSVGGLQRVKPGIYPALADSDATTDRDIWNPDGRPGTITDWFLYFANLTGDVAEEVNNATR